MRIRALVILMLVAGACGGAGGHKPAAAGHTITITNFAFAPAPLRARVGDTITVVNRDGTNHTVTANDNSFDTGPFQDSRTIALPKAGTVAYHCNIHDYMKGVIQVDA